MGKRSRSTADAGEDDRASVHFDLRPQAGRWWVDLSVGVKDKPGEMAAIAGLFADQGVNIEQFLFNRSQDPDRVTITASCATAAATGSLLDALSSAHRLIGSPQETPEAELKADITDTSGLLKIKVRLENRPGTLAGFARELAAHQANVIYMAYDDASAPGLAEIVMATGSAEEVSTLLLRLEACGYHIHVEWKGEEGPIDDIVGLSPVEAFVLKLKRVLPRDKADGLAEVLRTSGDLHDALVSLRREAGRSKESMAASEVFTNVLQLAAASLSRTGANFSLRLTGPLKLTDRVSLYMLACPTGANAFLLKGLKDKVLIDSSYGLYFPDVMDWLARHSMDPSRITSALFTHADADHAGWAAPLEERFGTKIYMHPDCIPVLEHENRAWGSHTTLESLNGAYTRLINRFTELKKPAHIHGFSQDSGEIGGFRIIGRFVFEDLELKVLGSRGGHVPGKVFFMAEQPGLLFSGDYLIDVPSLSDRTKTTLTLARLLMTSTNVDSAVFAAEMEALKGLMRRAVKEAPKDGLPVRIFPGHGEFYAVSDAEWA